MMEDEIKSTAAGEENQAGAHAPSTPSEAVAAPAPTPAADVNASVSAPAAANPAAAQQGAPASFCRNCGQALAVGTPSARSAVPRAASPVRRRSLRRHRLTRLPLSR